MPPVLVARGSTGAPNPLSIAGCRLWLKCSDPLGLNNVWQDYAILSRSNALTAADSDDDSVGFWTDKSSQDYNICSPGQFSRAHFFKAVQNGKNVIRFNDFLAGDVLQNANSVLSTTTAWTIIMVVAPGSSGRCCKIGTMSNVRGRWDSSNWSSVIPVTENPNLHITTLTYSDPNVTHYTNGVQDGTKTTTGNESTVGVSLGQADGVFGNPEFYEVLIYDSLLSGGNLSFLWAYLNSEYAIF